MAVLIALTRQGRHRRITHPAPAGGLALFAGMTLLYAVWDGSWWVCAVL